MKNNHFFYLASYPKSGNTWCRLFISYLKKKYLNSNNLSQSKKNNTEFNLNTDINTGSIMSSRKWFDELIGFSSSELSFEEVDLLRTTISYKCSIYENTINYHKIHDSFRCKSFPFKPIVPLKGCKGIIYLIRNPADITVSLSKFRSWTLDKTVNFLLDEDAELSNSRKKCEFQLRQFLGSWSNHVTSWIYQKYKPMIVVRYEDLILNPTVEFGRIAEFLGFPNEPKIIKKILEEISIANLQELEKKQGFYEHSGLSEAFFRSGKVGEGLEILSNENLKKLSEKFDTITDKYGYFLKKDNIY